jgi:hypothetical protein
VTPESVASESLSGALPISAGPVPRGNRLGDAGCKCVQAGNRESPHLWRQGHRVGTRAGLDRLVEGRNPGPQGGLQACELGGVDGAQEVERHVPLVGTGPPDTLECGAGQSRQVVDEALRRPDGGEEPERGPGG